LAAALGIVQEKIQPFGARRIIGELESECQLFPRKFEIKP
jgi:hypothetical protein